jgi:hypothetical protein
MIYRQRIETKAVTVAMGATTTLRVPQQRRRLEGFIFSCTAATAGSGTPIYGSDHILPIVKEIRVKVNDKLGARNAVQVTGPALIAWNLKQGVALDRFTALARSYQNLTSASMKLTYPVFIRHPAIEEPVGNLLGIPLDQVQDDVIIEVDIEAAASVMSSGSGPSIASGYITFLFRDVASDVVYLPTELVTNTWSVPSTGRQTWDVPQGGFLSALLVDTYQTYPTARRASANGNWEVRYGTNIAREIRGEVQISLNDVFLGAPFTVFSGTPATAATVQWAPQFIDESHLIDFLWEDSFGGSLSPASMLNANAIPLGGDKVQLANSNFAYADTVKVTHHKFLTRNPDDLKVLIGG